MAVYVRDSYNNYIEAMTKEETLAAIQAAAEGGDFEGLKNCAFVTKLKELNRGLEFGVWVGTQAEYNALTNREKNVLYLISDDPLRADMANKINNLVELIGDIDEVVQGHTEKVDSNTRKVTIHEAAIAAHNEIIAEHNEAIAEHGARIAEFSRVGYTTLYNELTEDFKTVAGITLAENYDAFDFLIFEFNEVADESANIWNGFAMLPTCGLSNNTRYGLYVTFLATEGRCTVSVDTTKKNKVFFLGESGSKMRLAAIYGYNKKGGA